MGRGGRWLAAFYVHYRVHKSTLLHSGLKKTTRCLLNVLRACKFITHRRFGFSVQMRGDFWIVNDIRVGRPLVYQHSWTVVACQPPSRHTLWRGLLMSHQSELNLFSRRSTWGCRWTAQFKQQRSQSTAKLYRHTNLQNPNFLIATNLWHKVVFGIFKF